MGKGEIASPNGTGRLLPLWVKYSPATAFSCGSVMPLDSCRDCCDADDARHVPEGGIQRAFAPTSESKFVSRKQASPGSRPGPLQIPCSLIRGVQTGRA